MKKIKWGIDTGYTGCTKKGEFLIEDDATDEEINDCVLQNIDYWWEVEDDN